ncbi:MAG: hypothetical protein Q8Q35_03240 [Nanoarchaeota archaeon]|nr:hypothetical protein [Nanoarchaeota archaeon]
MSEECRAFLAGIIECTSKDIASKTIGKKSFLDAYEWIMEDNPNDTYECTFRNLCIILDLDSSYMRQGLIKRINPNNLRYITQEDED